MPPSRPCPSTRDGVIDLDVLDTRLALEDAPALVSVMLANNETGTIQPLAGVVEVARRHNALVHCDAVQAAGRMALSFCRPRRRHADAFGP